MIQLYTKLQILTLLIILAWATWIIEDYDKKIEQLNIQRQLINKQQEYIKNVVAPVKRIMYRNHCRNQEIYTEIMKTKHPVYMAKIAEIESGFYQYAVSWANCYGLFQISWEHGLKNPFDIKTNIQFGAAYFEEQLQRFGTVEKAIWAYNAGPAAVGKCLPVETAQYIKKFKRGMEI